MKSTMKRTLGLFAAALLTMSRHSASMHPVTT